MALFLGLGCKVIVYVNFGQGIVFLVQESSIIVINYLVGYILSNDSPFLNSLSLIDLTPFLENTSFLIVYVNVDYIKLVELLCPSIRDSILYLIFELFNIRLLR
jgi:hypothetical protein